MEMTLWGWPVFSNYCTASLLLTCPVSGSGLDAFKSCFLFNFMAQVIKHHLLEGMKLLLIFILKRGPGPELVFRLIICVCNPIITIISSLNWAELSYWPHFKSENNKVMISVSKWTTLLSQYVHSMDGRTMYIQGVPKKCPFSPTLSFRSWEGCF